MKRSLFYIILFLYLILFLTYLYNRLLIPKVSKDPLIFLFLFLGVYFLIKLFKGVIICFVKIKNKIKKSKLENDKKKILKQKIENLNLIIKEFRVKFLYQNKTFCYFSLCCLKFYNRNQTNFVIHYIFLIVPTILLFVIYIIEVINQNFYYFLYALPITFLLKNLGSFILSNSTLESKRLLHEIFEKNFPIFFYNPEENIKDFFLVNRLIKCHFFFHSPFKNKFQILFFWDVFAKLRFYNIRYRSLVDFAKPQYRNLTELFFSIQLIIYLFSVIIILSDSFLWTFYFFTTDLFIVINLFIASFLIFIKFLNYLNKDQDFETNTQYFNFFQKISNIEEFYKLQSDALKNELVNTYVFLSKEELKEFSDTKESIKILEKNRHPKYDILLTLDEINTFFAEQKKILSWFNKEFALNRINMEIFEHEL